MTPRRNPLMTMLILLVVWLLLPDEDPAEE